jgi:hypothetical protein
MLIDTLFIQLHTCHMLTLQNQQLEVQLLDPIADQNRFGTRYCTGGYIFQIIDALHGPVLTGPTYPESFNVFDGQGIPDAFNLGPLRGAGDEALILGTGLCDLAANVVKEFCRWEIERSAASVRFVTLQQYGDWRVALTRTITLAGRTVRSHTSLHNSGRAPVPMRWFPHPFYPQTTDDELCWFNTQVDFPADDAGYARADSGFIRRRNGPWNTGYYLPLSHAATAPLTVLQRHPTLGLVAGSCSYTPDFFPIWGNPQTFSWEPFLERTVASGQLLEWHIDYHF